ncbi:MULTISPECIES: winged helix-turn-helix domain-containing protein [Thermus]|uniref:winged helix-turn-helix domain-containing protein n=1 Tax=Thermus brockianus TaxID=56956 RepID=UPI001F164368|nr:winged helix-turn-helix domain-containing protein [Thermus brockianus]
MASKSETIRELYRKGKSVSEIAKELGLSYQRVYNTLRRAGLLQPKGTPSETEVDPKAYGRFIEGLEILSVELVEVQAKLERPPQKGKPLEPVLTPLKAFGPDKIEGGFKAGLELHLDIKDALGSFGFLKLRVAATYQSAHFPEGAFFQTFSQRNLPLNLWPYLRLYVDFLTSQMGLPRLVLPVLKL